MKINKEFRVWKSRSKKFDLGIDKEFYKRETLIDYMIMFLMTTTVLIVIAACLGLFAKVASAEEIDLQKIAQIESSGNPKAYNKYSKATGLYQITPICLKDYNNLNNGTYTINDMFEPKKAYSVASWYLQKRIPQLLKHFKKPVTLDTVLIAYNCGVGCVGKTLPKETKDYILKYRGAK